MPLTAAAFLGQVRQVKGYLDAHPDAAEVLSAAYETMWASFKSSYTADDFKALLAAGGAVDSNLEELVTSALLRLNQERARAAAATGKEA